MSTSLGRVLPPPVLDRIGVDAAARHRALVIPLLTVDADGFPHVALLSASEVVAHEPGRLRWAIGAESRTAGHLRARPRATLLVADAAGAFYVKLAAAERPLRMEGAPWSAVFEGEVYDVLADAADPRHEGTSHLTSGLAFHADPAYAAERARVRAELAGGRR